MVYVAKKGSEVVYVGQTKMTLAQRKGKHVSEARLGRGSILGAGIRKHGEAKFTWEVVKTFTDQNESYDFERKLIAKYRPRYNQQEGGRTGYTPWNKGRKETRPEVLRKISDGAKARKGTKRGHYSDEAVSNIREAKLKSVARPFKCHENGRVYQNKVEAAEDLGIGPVGISLVLMPQTRNKSYKGYTFSYISAG